MKYLEEDYELPDSVAELDDVASHLYELYFKETDKVIKKQLMELHNKAAERINKAVGWGRIVIISRATKEVIQIEEQPAPAVGTKQVVKGIELIQGPPVEKAGGKIGQILDLYKSGKTKKEIIAMGYNKSTVHRQTSEYDKKQNN